MLRTLRHRLFRALRLRGLEIRKAPGGEWRHLDVFRLAAEALMAKRGDGLRFVQIGANDGVFSDPIRDFFQPGRIGLEFRRVPLELQQ